jgi:replicative DNA helicase
VTASTAPCLAERLQAVLVGLLVQLKDGTDDAAARALTAGALVELQALAGEAAAGDDGALCQIDDLAAHLVADHDRRCDLAALHGGVVGVRSGLGHLDEVLNGLEGGKLYLLAAMPGAGKCLAAHTLIDDPATGARMTIEEAVRRKMAVVSNMSDTGCVTTARIAAWVDSGIKPCYRVTTRSGRSVEVTGHHPFFTVVGWTPLHDIAVGTSIAVPATMPIRGHDDSVPDDLVRLLAYYVAEGGLTQSTPRFTNTDPLIVDDFKGIIARHFPTCHIRQYGIEYAVTQRRTLSANSRANPVVQWLTEYGLWGKGARHKRIPVQVWTWTNDKLALFLRALMSCDGSIYAHEGAACIEYCAASEALVRDVQHALLRFGIAASLRKKTSNAWRVAFAQGQDVARYQACIGWIGEKASRAAWRPLATSGYRSVGHLPREVWRLVRAAAAQQGLPLTEVARRAGETIGRSRSILHPERGLTRGRLARYAEVLGDAHLARLAGPHLYWDTIESIEPVGDQRVYDLTVPEGANFVAQDVFVHNTTLALQMAATVAQAGAPALYVSLENDAADLARKTACRLGRVSYTAALKGKLDADAWARAVGCLSALGGRLYLSAPRATMPDLDALLAGVAERAGQPPALLVLDYLQAFAKRAAARVDEADVRERIDRLTPALRALGERYGCAVLAISSQNRAGYLAGGMASLKESGDLEYGADVTMILARPGKDEAGTVLAPPGAVGLTLKVDKNRQGLTGQPMALYLFGDRCTVTEAEAEA